MDNYRVPSVLSVQLGVMNRWVGFYRLIEALHFALLVEEAILVALRDEEIKLEVAAGKLHTARDGGPLAEGDGLVLGGAVGEGVATDDVFSEHVAEREEVGTVHGQPLRGWVLGEDVFFQSGAAGLGVVGEDVDAVAGADGDEALELPFGLGFDVLQKGEFAAQDFDEEVAVSAGGLEEAAVEPERLVAH